MAEQTYKVNFKVDTSELDIAQAKADKLLATMKEIEKVGEKITDLKATDLGDAEVITKSISDRLLKMFSVDQDSFD